MKRLIMICASTGALLCNYSSYAGDVEAGDYDALPPGTNVLAISFINNKADSFYSGGNEYPEKAGFEAQMTVFRLVHFTNVGKYTIDPQVILPVGSLKAKGAMSGLGDTDGIGDVIVSTPIWLLNEPEHRKYFAVSPMLTLPTGSYNADRPLNLGENRWKFELQAGYSQGLSEKFALDVVGGVTLHGENNEFGSSRSTMKQDPSYQLQTILRYQVTPKVAFNLNGSRTWGGETKVNGIEQGDRTQVSKWNAGIGWLVMPTVHVLGTYGQHTSVHSGFKDDDRFHLRIVKMF